MFRQVASLEFGDLKILFPAFITIFTMPLTYSISTGLALGFLSYILVHLLTFDFKKIEYNIILYWCNLLTYTYLFKKN